ncbi:MAG: hypothetical protein JST30_15080 [Armatimonadetes bacterium]|nr:hypothetical protein [Armatimonadota bacterium]
MKKWLIAFTAGAVVIGCGGGSGLDGINNGNNGGGGGGTDRTIPTVNLKPNAQVQILYLSGQGRRAPGSQIAVMNNIRIFNSPTDYWPKDLQGSGSAIRVQLDGYTLNHFVFDVPMSVGSASKTYTQFPLEIAQMDEEQGGQPVTVYSGPPFLVAGDSANNFFKLNMQLFPGRQTSVQVLLNDAMLTWDATNGIAFDAAQFKAENYSQVTGALTGFLSDMIAFDVSSLPAAQRPLLQNGERAEMVHFSGDLIGISGHFFTVSGREEAAYDNLSPIVIDSGIMTKPVTLGANKAPGIFTVMEPDPRDPFGTEKINAIQGFYRAYTEVLSNLSEFGAVAIPSTRSTTSHQFVMFNRNSNGTITACWQGVADFTGGTKGVLRLYSLEQLPDAGAQPRATGEVFYTKSSGVVRSGTFSVSNVVGNATFPFPRTGGFVVFR